MNQSQSLVQTVQQQHKQPVLLPAIRSFQTTPVTRDIDSAAKFIGAGAATVGVAGSGLLDFDKNLIINKKKKMFLYWFWNIKYYRESQSTKI